MDVSIASSALIHAAAATLRANDAGEYSDPETGEGRGTRDFSWTAALALREISRR